MILRRIFFTFIFLTSLNCGKEKAVEKSYEIQIITSPGGNVSSTGGTYSDGATLSIEALPNSDYEFSGWSNGSQENPLLLTITNNLSITANFTKKSYPIITSIQGNGQIEKSIIFSAKTNTEYTIGSVVNLSAVAANKWRFTGWTGDISSNDNPLELTVNSTKTITANFEETTQSSVLTNGVSLSADGETNTYDLITSVLAPGYNPVEVPDCNHPDFGDHIDQIFAEEINRYAFRFHIHVTPDNDRCIKFDRQRNEIKSYDKSPESLLGRENERVTYRWKFKLAEGFQSSSKFTHIHQLKSVGGNHESMPMYTLTTRKSSPDRLELRYGEIDSQITLIQTDLAPFINRWLSVTQTIEYGMNGFYQIEIRDVSNEKVLFHYINENIVNWREGGEFVRPKWGIYRSLIYSEDLRDEEILFADFNVSEE